MRHRAPHETITFRLDGRNIEAAAGETIREAASRAGVDIQGLCSGINPGYATDGNCRLCVVQIDGERALAASCRRTPYEGMVVSARSDRANTARRMVMELLLSEQPEHPDSQTRLWQTALAVGVTETRFKRHDAPPPDHSHAAITVNLEACIRCTNCVRACRDIQVNDVIGLAFRGASSQIVFDQNDPLAMSTCVACGECVQACPTGALLPATVAAEQPPAEQPIKSLCPYCGVGCQMTYHVDDNKIRYAEGRDGPANHNRLCVKGRFGFDYVHHPHRLTTPLIRKDGVGKNSDDIVDPADPFSHFREATWDEALSRAADGLTRIRDQHGPRALAGFGSAKGSNEEAYLFQKLVRCGFGCNNVDHCTRLCHASSVAALMEGIGSGAVTAPFAAALDADVIIVIGARPEQNHPVAATFIKNAVKAGTKLIVIDPRRQSLARHADIAIQFTPGTDVTLLNAMLHTIIDEGLADDDYIETHTNGYPELKTVVARYAPETVAPMCGVDATTIREAARMYGAAGKGIIFWGMGISQHAHGTDNARCLIALALITGNIGRHGTGLHPLRGQNNVQGASDVGLIPMMYPDYQSVADPENRRRFEKFWDTDLDDEPGLTVVEVMDAIRADTINGMYIMGENPAMSDPDTSHTRAALATLHHLVVQDIFLTETAAFADVILPAGAFLEKAGSFTNTNRQVQLAKPVLEPPANTRPDWWIIQEIANRTGLAWTYDGPEAVFAEMREIMPSIKGITWQRLEREGAVSYPVTDEDQAGQEILFADKFPTPDGRGRIVPAETMAPDETPDSRYPLVLTTGRMLEHWHTGAMSRRATVLDQLEPTAVASVNPQLLNEMGIKPGEMITITSRRGDVTLMVRADPDVPESMVFVPFCFNEAAANRLTNPVLDPFGKIPELKYCAVRIERTQTPD